MSNVSKVNTSVKSSSWPEVGKYAQYEIMSILFDLSTYCTPQKRSDTTGNFVTCVSIEDGQPRADPCQVGPESIILSSGGTNMSEDVVRNLNVGKSVENISLAL